MKLNSSKHSAGKTLLYSLLSLSCFLFTVSSDFPASIPNLMPTCSTSADCPSYLYPRCASAGSTCDSCHSDYDCTHLSSTATCSLVYPGYCIVPCSGTTDNICTSMSAICQQNGGSYYCSQCSSDPDCSPYPATIMQPKCLTISSRLNVCGYCTNSSSCQTGYTCNSYKCTQCMADSDCTIPAAAPRYCQVTYGGNTCVDCLSNAQCQNPMTSRCSNGICVVCAYDSDCSQFTGRNICVSGTCSECGSDSDCKTLTASYCRTSDYTCQPCLTNSQCAHLSTTASVT